jgi:hypothetical protein
MKNQRIAFTLCLMLVASALTASCGWKPEVSAVPITPPWSTLALPVQKDAVVWKSDPNEFRAVHRDDKKTVAKNYRDALEKAGWSLENFNESGDRWEIDMKKAGATLRVEFYDFNNTGVLIEKK